jgi:hypothetical protein
LQFHSPPSSNRFHFENFWLLQPWFVEAVQLKLAGAAASPSCVFSVVDVSHHCAKNSWQFMRGWEANVGAEMRLLKGEILGQIQAQDVASSLLGLTTEEWLQRYAIEASLMEIYKGEDFF